MSSHSTRMAALLAEMGERDQQLVTLLCQTEPRLRYWEISEQLGLPLSAVGKAAREYIQIGLVPGRRACDARAPTQEVLERLRLTARRRRQNWTWNAIGLEQDCSRQAVHQITQMYPQHFRRFMREKDAA